MTERGGGNSWLGKIFKEKNSDRPHLKSKHKTETELMYETEAKVEDGYLYQE